MKKSFVIIISVILLFNLVVGQENSGEEKNLTNSLKNISEKLNISNIRNYQSDITLPGYIQKPTRFVFQIDEDKDIGIEYFIVLVALFVILLAIISGTIYMTPLHRKPIEIFIFNFNIDYIIGGIITLIVALTGVIDKVVSDWFFSLKLYEELLNKMGWWVIFLILLIFIVLFFAIRMFFGMLRKKLKIEKAKVDGENVKTMNDMAKETKKSMDKLAESPKKSFNYQSGMRRGGEKSTRGRFVSRKATERYSKMFGDEEAKKRFER